MATNGTGEKSDDTGLRSFRFDDGDGLSDLAETSISISKIELGVSQGVG